MKLLSSVLFCLMSCVLALAANSALSSQELTSRQKHIITIAAYTGRGGFASAAAGPECRLGQWIDDK